MSVETVDVDGVMVTTVDDGKVNALSFDLMAGLRSAIAAASAQGRPLVITGREGCLSAGFDLAVVNSGDQDSIVALFTEGAELYKAIIRAPIPVIASCTGHALAGGALLLLSADYRIGRNGPYRLGLNEVRIGLALPNFAVTLATHRLERRYLTAAAMFAEVVSPERAVAMGYLDESVDDPVVRACALAKELGGLSPKAFELTKRRVRQSLRQELESGAEREGLGQAASVSPTSS
jgi:enoyl-CoA hydratase